MAENSLEKFDLNGIDIFVSGDHRFGTDAFLLAMFADIKKTDTVCDLCSGCGIIPLILHNEYKPKKIYAVEIQEEAVELIKKSVSENNLSDTIIPVCADLTDKALFDTIPHGSVSAVTVNPPYFKAETGLERLSPAQAVARHELKCDLDSVIKTASALLKYGGSLKICHIPERLTDLLCAMRKYNIEPKSIVLVQNKSTEKPWLVLASGKKGGKSGVDISLKIKDEMLAGIFYECGKATPIDG